ncbi:hypothetical protein CP356_09545 [Lactobacillus sp. UMNPBX5]|nr:hypothetical protein CP356_09545 [Lactobacillus sp. UMNPBX5]
MEVYCKLDRITVSGKIGKTVDLVKIAVKNHWKRKIDRLGNEFAVVEREFNNGDHENKAVLMPNPYQEFSWRIDTSNHLNKHELKCILSMIPYLADAHLTRIDVAFDFINGQYKPMKHIIVRDRARQSEIRNVDELTSIYGSSGDLQTLYCGARSSDFMIRIYNKKIETTRHHKKLPDNVEEWERWELQLRGKRSYEWLESAKIMLSQIKYPNYQNLDPGDIAVLHSIDDRVVSFKDFSKKKAARLRKLRKESVGYSDDYAKAGLQALEDNANKINEQVEIFLGQLNLSD